VSDEASPESFIIEETGICLTKRKETINPEKQNSFGKATV
jgi:hypothetical protein